MEKYLRLITDDVLSTTCLISLISSVFLVVLQRLYQWLRPKFPIRVKCWFCHVNFSVVYEDRNSWECPSCQQYNGFDKNGDYNRPVSSHYDSSLNSHRQYCDTVPYVESKNGLCNVCNRNQVLKVKQLAQFESQNQECFDEEVEGYQQYLESVYQLCSPCEDVVRNRLAHWSRITRKDVLNWRLKRKNHFLHSKRTISTNEIYRLILAVILRLCSVFISFISLLQSCGTSSSFVASILTAFPGLFADGNWLLSHVAGFFAITLAILIAGKQKLQIIDAVVCFSWLLMVFTHLPIVISALSTNNIHDQVHLILLGWISLTSIYTLFMNRSPSRQGDIGQNKSSKVAWTARDETLLTDGAGGSENTSLSKEYADDWSQLQDSRVTTTCRSGRLREFSLDGDLSAMTISTPKKLRNLENVFQKKNYGRCCLPFELALRSPPIERSTVLSPPRFRSPANIYSPWGSSGNLQLDHSFLYGKFSCGYYQPFGSSTSCPVSRSGSISGDDRLSIFSEPVTVSTKWNSFIKPGARTAHRNSVSPSSSVSNNSNSSHASVLEEDGSFNRVAPTKLMTTEDVTSKSRSRKDRPRLMWCLLGLSLLGNICIVVLYTDWRTIICLNSLKRFSF